MVRTVEQGDLDVEDREAGDNTGVQGLLDALVDGRDVLLGHDAADDSVDELVAEALLHLLELDDGMAVLTATTGLTDELALGLLNVVTSGLAVGNLGLTNVSVNLELTEQTVDDNLEVQLTHAGDDGLAGLVVGGHLEGRVLLGELGQSQGHLVLLGLGLGLDGNVDNGLSELDLLEDDLLALFAQGVTGGGVLEADASDDVAGGSVVTVDTLGGVHLEDAAEALALTVGSVDHVGAGLGAAGVNADVGELTDERVGHDLEDQAGEGLVEGRMTLDLLAGVRIGTGDGLDVERAGR